jgi:hypothetical protein
MKLFGFCSLLCLIHLSVTQQPDTTENVILDRVISNDFETGSISPFTGTGWNIQSSETSSTIPNSPTGNKLLLADPEGSAVLRSPVFTALPGGELEFTFWMQSPEQHLQVFWSESTKTETLLIDAESSPLEKWQKVSVQFPFNAPTNISVCKSILCGLK